MTSTSVTPCDRARQWWVRLLAAPRTAATEAMWRDVRRRHPSFARAVAADARVTALTLGDHHEYHGAFDVALLAVRLALVTDAFLAQCCYRAKARCQALRIPVVPRVLHHLAIAIGQICIGDPTVVDAGVSMPHGNVVVDGITEIAKGVVLGPFTVVGLVEGHVGGPKVGEGVVIATGAKVLGPVTVGPGASIGANAVVRADVPAGATAIGVPARSPS